MAAVHITAIGNAPANSLLKTPPGALKVKPHPPLPNGAGPNAHLSIGSRGKAQGTVPKKESGLDTNIEVISTTVTTWEPFEMTPEFKEIAASAGVQEDGLMLLVNNLHGEERSNFLSAFVKSGDNARELYLATSDLTDRHKYQERETFLDLADTLSEEGLQNFLTAASDSPKDLDSMIETASDLSYKQLENYMSAAAMADEDISVLTEAVNTLREASGISKEKELSGFLSAAARSGRYVMEFMETIQEVSTETGGNIMDYINAQSPGEDLDNFILMTEGASEDAINTIIDITPELTGQDRKELLKTASRLGENLELFTDKITTFTDDHPGATATDFSNFIITAGKAGKQVGTFLELSGQLDLGITSQLSAVDTANFLVAADKAGRDKLSLLTELTEQLKGTDRSNLLYGAAYTQPEPGEFLSQVEEMKEDARSDFLLSAANEDLENSGPEIYMKGILSDEAYEDFKTAAKGMGEGQLKALVDLTNELDETDRKNLLKMASGAGDTTDDLLSVVTTVSKADRKEFLEVGRTLIGEELENFIKGAKTAALYAPPGTLSKFVNLTGKLDGINRQTFLKTSATAEPDALDGLIDLLNELRPNEPMEPFGEFAEPTPFEIRERELPYARVTSFLQAASKDGGDLKGLVDTAEKLALTTSKQEFVNIFSSAAVTETYLGSMIQTYA